MHACDRLPVRAVGLDLVRTLHSAGEHSRAWSLTLASRHVADAVNLPALRRAATALSRRHRMRVASVAAAIRLQCRVRLKRRRRRRAMVLAKAAARIQARARGAATRRAAAAAPTPVDYWAALAELA